MLSKDSAEVKKYQEPLSSVDMMFNILDHLLAPYKDKAFKPRVHAELILLEFFYMSCLSTCGMNLLGMVHWNDEVYGSNCGRCPVFIHDLSYSP